MSDDRRELNEQARAVILVCRASERARQAGHRSTEAGPIPSQVSVSAVACTILAKGLNVTVRTKATLDQVPVGTKDTPTARARNRRVTITIYN
jgi:hypothetical protein